MVSAEIGHFLRARRDALQPVDVGLVPGGRRRAPGLRRTEVALLAGVSVDYYERLEQGRGAHPSQSLLAALARALRLTADERGYLYRLAGYQPPPIPTADREAEPGMRYLLDSLTAAPAHVVDDLTTVVAQNDLSVALFGPWASRAGRHASAVWQWFAEPESRMQDFLEDDEAVGRRLVAELRTAAVARGYDRASAQLVNDLKARSREFAAHWEKIEVEPNPAAARTLRHPRAGNLDVRREVLLSLSGGHRLVVLRPQPGTGTTERLMALESIPACAG